MISRRADANDKCAKIVTTISFNFRENISFCLGANNPFLQPGSPGQKWMKAIMVHNWWLQTDNKPFFPETPFSFISIRKKGCNRVKNVHTPFFWKGAREFIALFYLLRIFNFIVYILGICKEKTTINKKIKEQAKETNKSISEVCT